MYKNNNKSQYTQPARQVVATPATATQELHTQTVEAFTAHFTPILTPALLIGHRKGCYSAVINGTVAGVPLEQILGSDNAKVATEQVLANLTADMSVVS